MIRPILVLSKQQIKALNTIIIGKMTIKEAADKIGISYGQLWFPFRGHKGCSKKSMAKIEKFIAKHEVE